MIVAETLSFVTPALQTASGPLLEVGCGRGELAAALVQRGHRVVAIDTDPEAVAAARAAGVPAVEADLMEHRGSYGCLLFVRSLHHIPDLDAALDHAAELLRPGGLLLVDEFARERADALTAGWYYELRGLFAAAGLLVPKEGEGTMPADPLAAWRRGYGDPRLHTGAAIRAALGRRFHLEQVEEAPHLYRQLGQELEESPRGAAVTRYLLEAERARIARAELVALGLRVIGRLAQPRSSPSK